MHFEQGPIRPPSEAESLLIRINRNCPWNKCLFCPVYKGKKFSRRTVEEIKGDIRAFKEAEQKLKALSMKHGYGGAVTVELMEMLYRQEPELFQVGLWLYRGGKNVFLQDADGLAMAADQLVEVLHFLKEQFPTVERITTYARAKTAARRSLAQLTALRKAGLTRVHIGMETGNDSLLAAMCKGVTAVEQIEGGKKIKEAGLSLSEYVLLGLGGRDAWREHILDAAAVLNAIDPHFIRLRTLALRHKIPLLEQVEKGKFQPQEDEGTAQEVKLLLENLRVSSYIASDHFLNLLEEIEGQLPWDMPRLLAAVNRYLEMPPERRANFRLGRRLGYYRILGDMEEKRLFAQVEEVRRRLLEQGEDQESFLAKHLARYV
ncbi:MAG: radical SAM protein [Bacillota bacterium]